MTKIEKLIAAVQSARDNCVSAVQTANNISAISPKKQHHIQKSIFSDKNAALMTRRLEEAIAALESEKSKLGNDNC